MSDLQPQPDAELSWSELATAVFAAKGIHEGLWRVAVKLRFAGLTTNWLEADESSTATPTGMVGFEGIALFKSDVPGPMVFDAGVAAGEPVAAIKSAIKPAARKRAPRPSAKT